MFFDFVLWYFIKRWFVFCNVVFEVIGVLINFWIVNIIVVVVVVSVSFFFSVVCVIIVVVGKVLFIIGMFVNIVDFLNKGIYNEI